MTFSKSAINTPLLISTLSLLLSGSTPLMPAHAPLNQKGALIMNIFFWLSRANTSEPNKLRGVSLVVEAKKGESLNQP